MDKRNLRTVFKRWNSSSCSSNSIFWLLLLLTALYMSLCILTVKEPPTLVIRTRRRVLSNNIQLTTQEGGGTVQIINQTEEKVPDTIMSKWNGEDNGAAEADRVINLYLKHRQEGMERREIAQKIFQVSMPDLDPPKHEDSYPFLSGDTLRAFADIIFERDTTYLYFATKNKWRVFPKGNRSMRHGDVIFVKTDDIEQFAIDILPKLNRKFVLITHNSDLSAPVHPHSLSMLDHPNLIYWLTQNAAAGVVHSKLIPVPIGLQNQQWHRSGQIKTLEPFIRDAPPLYEPKSSSSSSSHLRDILVYINFSPNHHELRRKALKTFAHLGTIQERDRDKLNGYLQSVINSKFVLSPPGLGEDCHRTWESVLLGAIPVVSLPNSTSESGMKSLFDQAPVYVLDDWDNVAEEQFVNFQVSTKGKKLVMAQYWFDLINSHRSKYRRKSNKNN